MSYNPKTYGKGNCESWCSGEVMEECAQVDGSACVQSSLNCEEEGDTDGSCADACCKTHDTWSPEP